MPDICTSATACSGGGHRTLTIGSDTLFLHESEIVPLSADEKRTLLRLAIRYRGVALAQLLNRVIFGDEATNVKIYSFLGPGVAITKTNIGTTYVNICPGLNGERQAVDLTGCTQYRFILHANVVTAGAGQTGVRVVLDSNNTVLHEETNIGAAGEREGDTDWQNLPAAFLGLGFVYLRAQAKSTVGADDPVFRSLKLGLR